MHHHPQNQERSSICQSSLRLDLVSFPVLGQIKPQAPLHGGALPSIPLSFSLATILPPEPKDFDFSCGAEGVIENNVLQSRVGIVYSWDYDGIWSSPIPQLSFLIKEDILGECFRISSSSVNPRISPLATEYEHPQLSLSIITSVLETNKIEPKSYLIIPC